MLSLNSITITNFRAYRGTHKFEFPVTDGLYFFTGQNLVTPALGPNGSGKSTFLDAITWCLYGRTTRGLKANEVLPWDSSVGCQVALALTVGKQRLKVKRSQKPNNLLLDDKPVDQEELEKHIRLNFDSFLYSVLNTQFGESFFALLPSAKLTLFSDIMRLDFWLKKSDEASNLAKQQQVEIEALQTQITRHEGQVSTILDDIKTLQVDEKAFEDAKAGKLASIKEQSVSTYKEVGKINTAIDKAKAQKSELLPQIKKANERAAQAEQKVDDFLNKIALVSKRRNAAVAEQELLEKQLLKFSKLGDGDCPTCFQKISFEHLGHHKAEINGDLEDLKDTFSNLDKVLRSLTEWMILAKNELNSKTALANELRDEVSQLDVKITLKTAQVKSVDARLDELGQQLHEVESGRNPHSAMLTAKRAKLKELKRKIAEDTEAKQQLEAEHVATSFWIKGFKRVRLFIIEQAFRSLEIEVNNCLAQLGLTDWQVTFDVERENKSGGITKGFVVFIKSPANKEPVRWESWSGGETQRLQLAGDLGLANLIMHQAGLTNTIEFFDEPSTHLSAEGMSDLANMLHERAISEGKRIWIVDHTSVTNFGEFEGIIIARKDINGSSITYDNGS